MSVSTFNQYIETLFEFLRIPSVSSLPEYANDMVIAAQFLQKQLEPLGFTVNFHWPKDDENTPPLVFGQHIDNPNNKTVLIYGHYDVQPAGSIDSWISNPFEPEIRDGKIYARGATDDKGQIMTHLAALSEMAKEWGDTWPINVKVIFEGQEEQGSPGMQKWLIEKEAQDLLSSDVTILCDTPMVIDGEPTIIYGLRGIVYFKIEVRTAEGGMHSGTFGGGILNPANALSYILSQLLDVTTGKVLIPGFYDDVIFTQEERDQLKSIPFSEEQFLRDAQNAKAAWGNKEFTLKERTTIQPTLDINGIWGGDETNATTTAIPAVAHAKFTCRTVAHQDPDKIFDSLKKYVQEISPKEVDVTIEMIEKGEGLVLDTHSTWITKVSGALETTFGRKTIFDRDGASIPAVAAMKKYLHSDPIMFGYALQEDYHVPNEKFSLEYFQKGIETNKLIYTYFSQ